MGTVLEHIMKLLRRLQRIIGSSNGNKNRKYADSDTGSDLAMFNWAYRRTGGTNSTPRMWGKEIKARLKGLSSGVGTPTSVSGRTEAVVFMEEDERKEWVAQLEPGVLITFVSLPQGGNDLKRIRFSFIHKQTCSYNRDVSFMAN